MNQTAGHIVRTVIWSLVVPPAVTVAGPSLLLAQYRDRLWLPGGWHWLGAPPVLIGVGVYLWSAWCFVAMGHGTPNPLDPPRQLVARGPYACSRNPMYVACMLILVGEVVWTGYDSLARYLIVSLVLVWAWVRLWEEPQLARRHGAAYRDYCARVPRWLALRPRIAHAQL
jgi:protein-S-isoprenylcysteine O-methyltransferase Ste14